MIRRVVILALYDCEKHRQKLSDFPMSEQVKRKHVSRRSLLIGAFTCMALVSPAVYANSDATDYSERDDVQQWAKKVAEKNGLDADWILKAISKARHVRVSKKTMDRDEKAPPTRNWKQYKARTLTEERIAKGVRFMRRNEEILRDAENRYGVPEAIITAVLGIESIYGKSMGRYRALDVLTTLSFDHERRAPYFQKELEAFFILCKKNDTNPTSVQSSFAGAIGMCQFMPTSILKYALDTDGDGKIDLRFSAADAISSTANFLKESGWVKGLPIEWPCASTKIHAKDLNAGGILAHTTLQNLMDAGVEPLERIDAAPTTAALLIDIPTKEASNETSIAWYIGTENFATLLKYNRSYFYAQSVVELARLIETRKKEDEPFLFF